MARRVSALLVGLGLMAAACTQERPAASDLPSASLAGTRWVVTGFILDGMAGGPTALTSITLDFDQAGTGVSGSAGCNIYFGAVSVESGRLITGIGSTEMACEPEQMEQEARFLAALGRVEVFALDADRLALTAPDGSASIDLSAFVPELDRPLVGTVWRLLALVDGDTATSVIAGTSVTLVFGGSPWEERGLELWKVRGRVWGSAGCNHFGGRTGSYGPFGGFGAPLRFSDIVATEIACEPDVMRQENEVFEILAAAAAYAIEGDSLRISARDGRALDFVAE